MNSELRTITAPTISLPTITIADPAARANIPPRPADFICHTLTKENLLERTAILNRLAESVRQTAEIFWRQAREGISSIQRVTQHWPEASFFVQYTSTSSDGPTHWRHGVRTDIRNRARALHTAVGKTKETHKHRSSSGGQPFPKRHILNWKQRRSIFIPGTRFSSAHAPVGIAVEVRFLECLRLLRSRLRAIPAFLKLYSLYGDGVIEGLGRERLFGFSSADQNFQALTSTENESVLARIKKTIKRWPSSPQNSKNVLGCDMVILTHGQSEKDGIVANRCR
ncbi:hypothetical protein ARMSODRAFT_977305 [Armillaria solidipes]|uniref:Uncharacterized protein n=1 Tax=Armillaria solidipes TaxID=1076256 RepID=A0A2H3BL16_9AGAR|nr:hypothetical protein ARMSODRAFT_977305 [Armillaria solidipes]